ncbi:MAG: helix-turn-helix domain-containing protein [Deltaproteobacteria bacterium]|nr:helix-turn-helix domain-containing protein [Deltaproteobacteria bacterium]
MENNPTQQMTRQQIGKTLAEKRIERGLSHQDIEHVTRVSKQFIAAIENGDFDKLPGKVFVSGFIKSICKVLELDGDEVMKDFDQAWTVTVEDPEKNKKALASSRIIKGNKKGRSLSLPLLNFFSKRLLLFYIVVFATVAGLVLFARHWLRSEVSQPPPAEQTILPPPEEVPALVEETKSETSAKNEQQAVENPEDSMSVLVMNVHKDVKVKHRVAPQDFEFSVFKPGTYKFKFEDRADFHIFDAQAVDIVLNGKKLGILGKEGEERKVTFYSVGLDDSQARTEVKF